MGVKQDFGWLLNVAVYKLSSFLQGRGSAGLVRNMWVPPRNRPNGLETFFVKLPSETGTKTPRAGGPVRVRVLSKKLMG